MGISVKLIRALILFASLFLIWLLTFNGRIVSGELFRCEETWNHYNRYNPCTESKCIKDCEHDPNSEAANSDKCLSVSELEDGGYEEIINYGDDQGVVDIDNYEHKVGCCGAKSVSAVEDDDDDEEASANQGPKKFSCSMAVFVPEQSCVDIKCIQDCGNFKFMRAGCLDVKQITSRIRYPTNTDQTVSDVVSSSTSNDDEACGCYPQLVEEIYICSHAFEDFTDDENPCTEQKCFAACIGVGDSYGKCLKRSLIVVNIDYGFTNQDGLDKDNVLQEMDDSDLKDKLQRLDDSMADDEVLNPDRDSNSNDDEVENKDDSNHNNKACCCDPKYV